MKREDYLEKKIEPYDPKKVKTVEDALKVSNKAVAEALGGLPEKKLHCSVLAEQALRLAVKDYRSKKKE